MTTRLARPPRRIFVVLSSMGIEWSDSRRRGALDMAMRVARPTSIHRYDLHEPKRAKKRKTRKP